MNFLESQSEISMNSLYELFASKSEDILIIKYDGVRKSNRYNVIIIGKDSRFETISFEIENIQDGLRKAIEKYLNTLEKTYTTTGGGKQMLVIDRSKWSAPVNVKTIIPIQ